MIVLTLFANSTTGQARLLDFQQKRNGNMLREGEYIVVNAFIPGVTMRKKLAG